MSLELFDANYYLTANPDLGNVGINTADKLYRHFQTAGLEEGRPFSPFADINYYRLKNPDLVRARLTTNSQLYNHLKEYGIREGRSFSPLTDIDFYLRKNPDLAQVFQGDRERALEHLQTIGLDEQRLFSQLIDLNFYIAANPDVEQALGGNRRQILQHLLNSGIAEGRRYLAGDIGLLRGSQAIGTDPISRPVVTSIDSEDYYKFSLDTLSDISLNVEGTSAVANISLIKDVNNNGVVDETEAQQSIQADNSPLSQLDLFGVGAGTYFVKISHVEGDTQYQLNLSAVPANILSKPDLAGNTLNTALNVGDLTRPQSFNGFIGRSDVQDFYSFSVSTTSDVRFTLEGLSTDVNLRVIQDFNGNGVVDAGEILSAQSDKNRNPLDLNGDGQIDIQEYLISLQPPEDNDLFPSAIRLFNVRPGNYFVSVSDLGQDTAYDLRMESVPSQMPASGAGNANPVGFGAIGVLGDRFEVADFVGEANPYDLYQFTLAETRNTNIQLDRLAQPTDFFLIHDINNDDVFSFQEFVVFPTEEGSLAPQINRILGAGTYYLGVAKNGGNTPYLLTFEQSSAQIAPDAAGNTLATATDVGLLGEAQVRSDFVDGNDREDIYKFNLDSFKKVGLYLYDMSSNAQLDLIKDINGNGQVEPDELIIASQAKGAAQDRIDRILGPGSYFVRVSHAQRDTTYNLWLEGTPIEAPPTVAGNGLGDALNLGLLTQVQRSSGIIGADNPNDFYQFQLDRPRNLSLFLDGLSVNADLRLVQDRNVNGVVEPDEVLGISAQGGATLEEINLNLAAGNYYVWVSQSGGQTYYDLSVSGQPYNRSYGYGVVNAGAAVAGAIGAQPFPEVPQLGGSNWRLDRVNAPAAWNQGYTGAGVVVAVVDGALDYTHPDLDGKIWTNIDEVPGNGIDDDGNGFVDDVTGWNFWQGNNQVRDSDPLEGHATHVSGIIAGKNDGVGITGVAPDATIMPVRVIGPFTGRDEQIASGIRYAVDNGARVINLSLGGSVPSEVQQEALRYARDRGVVVVMAAGNDGLSSLRGGKRVSPLIYPAGFATESGLAVGALNREQEIAEFTNRAGTSLLDYLVAPGEDIYSSLPINTYDFWEGTSMAAPMVAGVAALMLSANPNLTPEQVEQIMTGTANPNGVIEDGVYDFFG